MKPFSTKNFSEYYLNYPLFSGLMLLVARQAWHPVTCKNLQYVH